MKSFFDRSKSLIIAEAGVNHNGDKKLAKTLIEVAAEAGADFVKFQSFHTKDVVSTSAPKAEYQINNTGNHQSQMDMLKKLELPFEWHRDLQQHAKDKGIGFTSTPFNEAAINLLVGLSVPFLKVSSTDLNNLPFLAALSRTATPLLLSTGMSDLEEVHEAIRTLHDHNCEDWALLHCLSQYPAPASETNLRAIKTLRQEFQNPIGYSDHTLGNETALAAVGLGAQIFEKHFTLDKTLEGPDHVASASPDELASYVNAIRRAEEALGDGVKRVQPSEVSTRKMARRTLSAARDLPSGHVLQAQDIAFLRPNDGIEPKHLSKVCGRTLKTDVADGTSLTWDMFT
jgi:N,N'-diacetyllegionaminate synthase